MAVYEVYHATPQGGKIQVINDFVSLAFTLNVNSVGVVNVTLPGLAYTVTDFNWMDQLRIERDTILQGDAPYFIGKRRLSLGTDGEYLIHLTAYHANILLYNRHIMSYASSAQAKGSAVAASNLMRRLVDENLGSEAAHSNRDKAAPLDVVSIEADDSIGETVSKSFTRRRLITVLQEIANASKQNGTPLFFGLKEVSGTLTFIVKADQWGGNKTTTAVLSPEFGNLINVAREWDYSQTITVAYALGGGERENRLVKIAENTTQTALNDIYFIEGIFDNANELNPTGLQNDADALLADSRVITTFEGEIQETSNFVYGTHWVWGDRLKAEFDSTAFNVWVNLVSINVSSGRETVRAIPEVVV